MAAVTDAELRQVLVERGPGWIRAQAATYGARATALPSVVASAFRPFFGADADRARWVLAHIENPPFYPELLERGADPTELLNFAAGMDGFTFETTIVIRPDIPPSPASLMPLLFHELVHVVQYRLLGVEAFAERYIDGWQAGRARFHDDPARRYVSIPLELMAYELQARYTAAPAEVFAVEPIVRERLKQ